jgi:uncharacterized DUF497 family protein
MEVTFDPAKNEGNIKKHGISLQRTEDFDFTTAFYDVDDSQDYGEVRYNAIGWLDALLHALTFTQHSQAIRAISLRRASRQEQITYDEES